MDDDDAADGRSGSQAHIMRLGRSQIARLEDSVGSLQNGAYLAAFLFIFFSQKLLRRYQMSYKLNLFHTCDYTICLSQLSDFLLTFISRNLRVLVHFYTCPTSTYRRRSACGVSRHNIVLPRAHFQAREAARRWRRTVSAIRRRRRRVRVCKQDFFLDFHA